MIFRLLRTEPAAVTAALASTMGVLTLAGVVSDVLAGAILTALGAWLVVVRQMVTPLARIPKDLGAAALRGRRRRAARRITRR